MPLWSLIQSLGPNCGLKVFIDHLSANSKGTAPEFQVLILFADCLSYVVTILDDVEMYEKQVIIKEFMSPLFFPLTLRHAEKNSIFEKIINVGTIFSSLHILLKIFCFQFFPEPLQSRPVHPDQLVPQRLSLQSCL